MLSGVRPDDLAATVLRALIARTSLDPASIDDVILGCTNQAGEDNRNIGRMASLLAGFPVEVPGQTVNRLCGSGMQAIVSAAHAICSGEGSVIIAGGVESMSRSPWVLMKPFDAFPRAAPPMADSTIGWRFTNVAMPAQWTVSLGETAEIVAAKHGVSRREQDEFALASQRKAASAVANGRFDDEIVAVKVGKRGMEREVTRDEHPRAEIDMGTLAAMRPAFRRDDGTVTAGSSSGINDGASAVLLMSEDAAREAGRKAMARVISSAAAGVSPEVMGVGPVPAIQKALARAGLTVADIDLIELNEAFASQAIACIRELGLDEEKVNVNGGAIALGHPLGSSGARIVATLVHEMRRRQARYGLAAMCIGVGQGIAMVLKSVQ
jgi:3-oxoadipyl-CoA thiolase